MGDAAGQFAYIEDPDGTLIEFVETHKVPLVRKLGLSINLPKEGSRKTTPALDAKSAEPDASKNGASLIQYFRPFSVITTMEKGRFLLLMMICCSIAQLHAQWDAPVTRYWTVKGHYNPALRGR